VKTFLVLAVKNADKKHILVDACSESHMKNQSSSLGKHLTYGDAPDAPDLSTLIHKNNLLHILLEERKSKIETSPDFG
jgi:hypothetical protein